jgi:uncharacterized protein Smg (DUF494 family)
MLSKLPVVASNQKASEPNQSSSNPLAVAVYNVTGTVQLQQQQRQSMQQQHAMRSSTAKQHKMALIP